jgi:hypothetical protein
MAVSAAKIRTLVQKAVNTDIGDLKSSVTYTQVTVGAYDPTTDTNTLTTTVHSNVACALVKVSEQDLDWYPANSRAQKALIPYLNLPITPKEDDYLTIDGERWDIVKIKPLPGTPVHVLFLRAT